MERRFLIPNTDGISLIMFESMRMRKLLVVKMLLVGTKLIQSKLMDLTCVRICLKEFSDLHL